MKTKRPRTLQSQKYADKRRKKLIGKTVLITLGACVCLALIIGSFHLPFMQISSVVITGTTTAATATLETDAQDTLKGSYFGIIPRTHTLFYSQDAIEDTILARHKQIESVRVEREGMTGIVVRIAERAPEALACDGFKEDAGMDTCYFLDESGHIYAIAPQFSEGVYARYYKSPDMPDLAVGEDFMTPERFVELQTFIRGAGKANIRVTGVLVGADGSYELYVQNRDESMAIVYFDDRTPFAKTLANLVTFWDGAMSKKIGTTTIPNFNYINLRFGNNVFFTTK